MVLDNAIRRSQRGVTLIELLLAIMIIAIAFTGLVSISSVALPASAAAQRGAQAAALAGAYLDEISAKPFADPDGISGEANRAQFDDVFDYDGLDDAPPRGANGVVLPGLTSFRVTVTVANTASFGPTGGEVPAADAAAITVSVSSLDSLNVVLHAAVTR